MTNEQLEKATALKWDIQDAERKVQYASLIKFNTCIDISVDRGDIIKLKIPNDCVELFKTTLANHYQNELIKLQTEFNEL
jgi:hypothetical protein